MLGLLGGIFGGISRNRMIKKQQELVNEQKRENQDWFDRRYNEDVTQRADAQAMLTRTADKIREQNRAAAGAQAVMGGTEEAAAAAKAANAKTLADATSAIAAAGADRQDKIEGTYRGRQHQLDGEMRQLEAGKVDGYGMANNAIAGLRSDAQSIFDIIDAWK